jgi:pimeloyl-ACP methyl ester carboxylesterase
MFKRVIGTSFERPSCWVLHGLLGQGRNWQSVSTALHKATNLQFLLLDLRNHGRSHGFAPPHTLAACVDDIVRCGNELGRSPTALIGHSLGGKVLLQLARSPAAVRLLRAHDGQIGSPPENSRLKLFIVDSFPGALVHNKKDAADEVDGVFDALSFVRSAPAVIPSKKWLLEQCAQNGISPTVALWLSSNVSELHSQSHSSASGDHSGGLRWMFDPAGAAAMFDSHNATNCWDVLLDGPPADVDLYFIMASKSSRWKNGAARVLLEKVAEAQKNFVSDVARGAAATRGNVFLHTVEAGHWVHTDNAAALTSIISSALM